MGELISTLIGYQIQFFASDPRTATIMITVLDALVIYAATLPMRKKASQNEFSILLFGIVVLVLVVLDLVGGGA